MNKLIRPLIFFLFLLQSCAVYEKTQVSLSNATDQGKVKVMSKDGSFKKYKNINLNAGDYYGRFRSSLGDWQLEKLDPSLIESIYIKDKKKSTTRTIILILGLIPPALILGTLIFWSIYGVV